MCTENEKCRNGEPIIVSEIVSSRVRVYRDINDTSRVDLIPLDVNVIRKRTDSWYEKYMGDSLTEHDTDSIFMTTGIDFLGIEDASDTSSVSGSYSEKACGCGDKTGLCGPPL
ncbi:hypothetical protein [Corynebacterium casei]|uniref:hypothetical protein n=1 Tax=Corynebacterium casei TaxID=160386 RepID=UPI003FD18627